MNKIAIVPMLFVAILLHCSSAFADPAVFFIPPTPDDGTTITETYAAINVTATDVNNITAFIDWNNSLVGWWRFNNDTDFKDYSTYSNDGTNSGSAYTTAGKFGGARAFDGADDYIDAGTATSLSITEEITIEAWIKATESQWNNAKQTIVSKWAHATTIEFQDTVNYDVYNAQNEDGANGMVGFAGAVFDGRYVYFVPNYNGTTHGKVLRYDTAANFSDTASWDVYNAENEDGANGMKGFVGAVFDGRHIYFVPNYHEGWYGTVLRLDTTANFSDTASWDTYNAENEDGANGMKGFTGAVFDGRHIYFVPTQNGVYHGKVLRYDTTATFSDTASWDTYNAENEDGANGMKGFKGAVFDGRHIYFVPYNNGTYFGKVLRYDTTASFSDTASWDVYNAENEDGANGMKGFRSAVFDGRHVYFVPYDNGSAKYGKVLRYDTTATFSDTASWDVYNAENEDGANGMKGFFGATFDGRHVYFVPYNNGARYGKVLRYDTTASFSDTASWDVYNAENEDGANGMKGFMGAAFDGRYVYFVPHNNGTWCGKVLKYDTLSNNKASYSLDYSTSANSFGDTPKTITFKIPVAGAIRTVSYGGQIPDLKGAYHHILGTYNGTALKLYTDGVLRNSIEYSSSAGILSSVTNLAIASDTEGTQFFNGTIDEVRIHNRALSAEEITASYNAGLHKLYHNFTGLVDGIYTYTAYAQNTDGNVNSTGTKTITVAPSNTAPTLSGIPDQTLNEDTFLEDAFNLNDYASDAETPDENLTYTAITASGAYVTIILDSDDNVDIFPTADWNGMLIVIVRVIDEGGMADLDKFTITVLPVNDAPVAYNDSIETAEGTSVGITLDADDVDGDALAYSIILHPAHGTLTGTAPDMTYTPDANYSGDDNFTFTANDSTIDSNTAFVSINITPLNDDPPINDTTPPNIAFVPPTDSDNELVNRDWSYVNVLVSDALSPNNLTAFIDWDNSLVGWWRFNNDTDFKDYSTYSNDGINSGSAYTTDGKFGGARTFDGVDDYVTVSDSASLDITDEITLELWAKLNDVSIKTVSSGGAHTCAVLNDGQVMCWGYNKYGQLGDGTTNQSETPVYISGISNAVSISAGEYHSCATLNNGSAMCWGYNGGGQLGDGTTTQRETPVYVSGITDAVSISAGGSHSCAILSNGSAMCWGCNMYNQLGDGTITNRKIPVSVSGITDAVSISAGGLHTCALLSNGSAMCWGFNNGGQLGDGTKIQRKTPVYVSGISDAVSISIGNRHTCVTLSNGSAMCWGINFYGELGDGTTTHRETPVYASGISDAVFVSAGGSHTCAILNNGSALCWGSNRYGQLGDGRIGYSASPISVYEISTAASISAGHQHACVTLNNGSALCWGLNTNGQLGDGTTTQNGIPTYLGISDITSISSGYYHTCVTLNNGSAMCWGSNEVGQLGDGTTTQRTTPVSVSGISNATSISAGRYHSCALLNNGSAMCWGNNTKGQLGDGTTIQRTTPMYVSGISNATSISAGEAHTCAILNNGSAMCWGENYGQLGDGTTTQRETPVYVSNISNVASISAGRYHSCATLNNGSAMCWGSNFYGELGDGTMGYSNVPVYVSRISNATSISAGYSHSCATLSNGSALCWGDNYAGNLGDGTTDPSYAPIYVSGISNAASISAGNRYTCANLNNGSALCWGSNEAGQLGDGMSMIPADTLLELLTKGRTAYGLWVGFGMEIHSYFNNEHISTNITDAWHHIVLSYDKNEHRLYVDGVLRDSKSFTGKLAVNDEGVIIARNIPGVVDEVRIWNRALSDEEIKASYNAGLHTLYHNVTNIADGSYTYTAYAQNLVGDIGQTETRTVTVDAHPPNILIISPPNTTSLTAGTTQTQINITTNENAICRYNTTDSNYRDSTNFATTGSTTHTVTYTGLSNGNTYNLYYWCSDALGNINQNATHHIFSVSSTSLYCGDRSCNNGETCFTCPADCGTCPSGGGGYYSPNPKYDTVVDNETQLPELPDFAGFTTINIPTEVDASEPIIVSGCLAGTENITNENMAELYIDGKILATSILNASGCFEATYTGYFDAGMHQISVRISGTDAGATRLFRLTADVFVESINLPQNIIANQNIKIGAQLSVEATGDVDVSLYVNNNLIDTLKNVHIKDRDVVEFDYAFTKAGENNVTVAAELTGKTDEKTVLAQIDSGTPTGFVSKVLASPLTRISLLLLLVAVWLYLRRKNRRS